MKRLGLHISSYLLLLCLLASCDKLEDSNVINETLPGRWAFSYKTTEVLDYDFSYEYVIFHADGTCALTYPDGQLEGTYRASDAVIRIQAIVDDEEQTLMWQVISMSPYKIVASYEFETAKDHTATITVILEKLP